MKKNIFSFLPSFLFLTCLCACIGCKEKTILSFDSYGAAPNTQKNASAAAVRLIKKLQSRKDTTNITVVFPTGKYHFYEKDAITKEYYISNHDQVNPKKIGFAFENLQNITIDGQGSEFIFHGRMIPFALLKSKNIKLKNFSIDFLVPALRQINVLEVNKKEEKVKVSIVPSGNYLIEQDQLIFLGEGYQIKPYYAMVFAPNKKLTYKRRDVGFSPKKVEEIAPDTLSISNWDQIAHTSPGERFVLRTDYRPTPSIFISECLNTSLENVQVRYAEGMGLMAQMSENIVLDKFSVCLRDDNDPRFFTTQADATHFSGCKGLIISKNGLYEHMADDAINVHGTYLKLTKRVDDHSLIARYMHHQTWGFKWGEPGDSVQFIESEKMEIIKKHINTIKEIKALDQASEKGAKEFQISFNEALPKEISEKEKIGLENLTWTPEVIFSDNIVRNNRARGALFSTPRRVLCENNLFDHTHGTAILLCGDCNGWYETGACKEVIIRKNNFVNALTATYQFTNAIISIYPEIPNLKAQKQSFHSNILIEDNIFNTFESPLLYAKSTDGIVFKGNTIRYNDAYKAFHWNKHKFFFEKVKNVIIENNHFDRKFNKKKDIRML